MQMKRAHWTLSWHTPSCPRIQSPHQTPSPLMPPLEEFRRYALCSEGISRCLTSMSESATQVTHTLHDVNRGKSQVFTPSTYGFCLTVFSTECKVMVKVIDVNNEMPLFDKNDVSLWTTSLLFLVLFDGLSSPFCVCVCVCSMAVTL